MNLTREDQDLLETEFPAEIEKEAAEQAAVLSELYEVGFEKMASNAADEMDQEMFSSPEYRLDEYHTKEAEARGAFLARYYVEGLQKEGAERHGDPLHYFYPAIDEYFSKIADEKSAIPSFVDQMEKRDKPVFTPEQLAQKDPKGKVGQWLDTIARQAKSIPQGYSEMWSGTHGAGGHLTPGERAVRGLKATGKAAIPAAILAGMAYGGHKGYKHLRNKDSEGGE